VNFPIGSDVYRSGYDGYVKGQGVKYVPNGESVWELSTNGQVKAKADKDFASRSLKDSTESRVEMSYVGVSTQPFPDKTEWIDEKRKLNIWRDVFFLDFNDLLNWLEQHPHVAYAFGAALGIAPCRVETLESWFENFNESFPKVKIQPSWFLSGREHCIEELLNHIKNDTRRMVIGGMGLPEALVVLASAYLHQAHPERQFHLSKLLLIRTSEDFSKVVTTVRNAILVPLFNFDSTSEGYVNNSNQILLCGDKDAPYPTVSVKPVNVFTMSERMRDEGIDAELAERAARGARLSFMQYQKEIGDPRYRPFVLGPISRANPRIVGTLLLINRWNGLNEDDLACIELLSEASREEWLNVQAEMMKGENPILRRVGHTVFATDLGQSVEQNRHCFTPRLIDAFSQLVLMVLQEKDPLYDIPPEERWRGTILTSGRNFSSELRDGISRTLLFIADLQGTFGTASDGQSFVDQIAASCLQSASPSAWYSLGNQLPLLAEAAPKQFLTSLLQDLSSELPASLVGLTTDVKSTINTGSKFQYLLWALERIAWNHESVETAVSALAKIASFAEFNEAGGAIASLREIFLPWHPSTGATFHERKRLLRKLMEQERDIARDLLNLLVSDGDYSVGRKTSRPDVRDFGPQTRPQPRGEVFEMYQHIYGLLFDDAKGNLERLASLSVVMARQNHGYFLTVLKELERASAATLDCHASQSVWRILQKLLHEQSSFSGEEWTLPPEMIEALRGVVQKLTPEDVVARNAWLFSHYVQLDNEPDDWSAKHEQLTRLRDKAVTEVFEAQGLAGLFSLASEAEEPRYIGSATARAEISSGLNIDFSFNQLSGSEDQALREFAVSFTREKASILGMEWIKLQIDRARLANWSSVALASLYLMLPPSPEVWDEVRSLGAEVEEHYWKDLTVWDCPVIPELALTIALRNLAEVERLDEYIDFISAKSYSSEYSISTGIYVSTLQTLQSQIGTYQDQLVKLSSAIARVLEHIASKGDIDGSELAALEYFYFPLIKFRYKPLAIERALADDPEFLVEVLSKTYRSDDVIGSELVPTDSRSEAESSLAWSLLHEWSKLPTQYQQSQNFESLRQWIDDCILAARRRGYLESTLFVLAQFLGKTPAGVDEVWPAEAVCELLEYLDNDLVDHQCLISRINTRGSTWRAMDEGGDQERTLAQKYLSFANMRHQFPRAFNMLTLIAKGYIEDGLKEDERASRRQELR